MRLTAIFESWHIGDGNYPPLSVGQLVNLSFQVEVSDRLQTSDARLKFDVSADAECSFTAEVLRVYRRQDNPPLVILQADESRFYVEGKTAVDLIVGQRVTGNGSLLLDYYVWVEFLQDYSDPPDLFYTLKVERIRKVTLPASFISRSEKTVSFPTRLRRDRYTEADVQDLQTMEGQDFIAEFYLIDLDDRFVCGAQVPKTFLSS